MLLSVSQEVGDAAMFWPAYRTAYSKRKSKQRSSFQQQYSVRHWGMWGGGGWG